MPARPFDYPPGLTPKRRKKFKHQILTANQDVLYYDTYRTGTPCDLIFYTNFKQQWTDAIEAAYPGSRRIQMANKLKLELSDGGTVSVFPSGKILIQGQQPKQRSPDPLPPTYLHQLVQGDPKAFPSQPRDIISPACPGSALGPPRPDLTKRQIPKPPHLPPFDVEGKRLYSEPLPHGCMRF